LIAAPVLLVCGLVAVLVLYLNPESVSWGWTTTKIDHTKFI